MSYTKTNTEHRHKCKLVDKIFIKCFEIPSTCFHNSFRFQFERIVLPDGNHLHQRTQENMMSFLYIAFWFRITIRVICHWNENQFIHDIIAKRDSKLNLDLLNFELWVTSQAPCCPCSHCWLHIRVSSKTLTLSGVTQGLCHSWTLHMKTMWVQDAHLWHYLIASHTWSL